MQTRRNRKRRLSVQNLETRKLFAADVGFGDMTYGPEAPAEIGSIRPDKVERPTFGPIGDTCPPCELENRAEVCRVLRCITHDRSADEAVAGYEKRTCNSRFS